MTSQELKEYIDDNITANGKGEISGEVLNTILNELANPTPLVVQQIPQAPESSLYVFDGKTLQETSDILGLTEEQTIALYKGEYPIIKIGTSILKYLGGDYSSIEEEEPWMTTCYGAHDVGVGSFAVGLYLNWDPESGGYSGEYTCI